MPTKPKSNNIDDFKLANVPQTLFAAANVIRLHGWTRGTPIHPDTGKVDIMGALALACHAHPTRISDDWNTTVSNLPPKQQGRFVLAWEALALYLGCDPTEWNDRTTQEDTIRLFRHVGQIIDIA
ncbi:MAG: hypothetical protein QF577_06885 [Phycisphaerae bacterium]|jgi:hypothetical protein|nr:hypothetical protein [Phycisphaerae bacterium]